MNGARGGEANRKQAKSNTPGARPAPGAPGKPDNVELGLCALSASVTRDFEVQRCPFRSNSPSWIQKLLAVAVGPLSFWNPGRDLRNTYSSSPRQNLWSCRIHLLPFACLSRGRN